MSGRLINRLSGVIHHERGTVRSDSGLFTLSTAINGQPIVHCAATDHRWTINWFELIALAEACGVAGAPVSGPPKDPAARFGLEVLRILEAQKEWNGDTADLIAKIAQEMGLAENDSEGFFKVVDDFPGAECPTRDNSSPPTPSDSSASSKSTGPASG